MNELSQVASEVAGTLLLLNALGVLLKSGMEWFPNKHIPLTLALAGTLAHMGLHGWTVQNGTEGFIAAVGAVFGHQLFKKATSNNDNGNGPPPNPPNNPPPSN